MFSPKKTLEGLVLRWHWRDRAPKNASGSLPQYLEGLVLLKNENKYSSLDTIANNAEHVKDSEELQIAYGLYFDMYRLDIVGERFTRYDSRIAPVDMKEEMVQMYKESRHSLKKISEILSYKHGMSVSSSTISRYARKELGVKNRREAKLLRSRYVIH